MKLNSVSDFHLCNIRLNHFVSTLKLSLLVSDAQDETPAETQTDFDFHVNILTSTVQELKTRLEQGKISTKAETEKYKKLLQNAVSKYF